MTDERWLARTERLSSLRGARHQPSDAGAKEYCSRCEEQGISRATKGRKGIVVVARSEAIAERRGNLAKSLSDGREGLPRLLARNDGRKMSRNDGKPASSQ